MNGETENSYVITDSPTSSPSHFNGGERRKKKVHIPFLDVDDLAYKTRQHDPTFIASITNLMQVPATITLTNGNSNNPSSQNGGRVNMGPSMFMIPNSHSGTSGSDYSLNGHMNYAASNMDIPDKLTADTILNNRNDQYGNGYYNNYVDQNGASNGVDTADEDTFTPPSTPTKYSAYLNSQVSMQLDGKTPQVAAELFKRMKPRRSSIEVDLHAEIRILRDKINILEHECQLNSRNCKIFYTFICGYVLVKTLSWLVRK